MKIEELPVHSYVLDADRQIYIERRSLPGSPESWVIKDGTYCLNKRGEWVYEPMPSNRTKSFISRTRWKSAADALAFWEQLVENRKVNNE